MQAITLNTIPDLPDFSQPGQMGIPNQQEKRLQLTLGDVFFNNNYIKLTEFITSQVESKKN